MRTQSGVEKLLPFDRLNCNDFFPSSVITLYNILSIYDHSVMMTVGFHEDVISCREVTTL